MELPEALAVLRKFSGVRPSMRNKAEDAAYKAAEAVVDLAAHYAVLEFEEPEE